LPIFFSKGSKFGQKWPFLDVLNTGKYRQIFAGIGIGICSPEYRYSGIGIYRIGNTNADSCVKNTEVLPLPNAPDPASLSSILYRCLLLRSLQNSDGDFGKYFHLPVSVNGKWILFTGK
jgi:hypothetical protein